MRRYIEISKLYEKCSMNRLSSFYKWIAAGRILRLINSLGTEQQTPNADISLKNFKRVLVKCIDIIIHIFENLCMDYQMKPSEKLELGYEKGFPLLKKRILTEITQLYHHNNDTKESIKLV